MGNVRAKGRWWYWFCGVGHKDLGPVFEIETWVLGAHGCFRVRYSLHSTISVEKKKKCRRVIVVGSGMIGRGTSLWLKSFDNIFIGREK